MSEQRNRESFTVSGEKIIEKVKEIIQEGNARRIIIKNEKEETIAEFPLAAGAVGALLAPALAALGAIAALVSKCTVIVEKKEKN
ncbi:MAG: DUF4342 domain-containing protein [Atribacterota bacterium]|jgi:hypothetical protein|nr:DUF4342 domain-containing protein [Atribacterota bacterium]MDY0382535.1 DUF4342 domain-containing protein [Atribacterota bacterium]